MKNNDITRINSPLDFPPEKPLTGYVSIGDELRLSNPAQLELLRGMEERGVPLRTTVRGFSMSPFIRDRDVLTIAPLNKKPLSVGQVVAFSHPENGMLVIHRIVKHTGAGWLLKGDNCPETDGLVTEDRIIGRVTRVERNGRKVRLVAGSKFIAFLSFRSGLVFLKTIWLLPRRTAGYLLRQLQGLSLYRKLARRLMLPVIIAEATESDMETVHRRFNPGAAYFPQEPNPNVTNFVATTKNKLAGFAQLVYHPEDNYPWTGYWLFSLQVWGLYRGLGIGEKLVRRCIEEAELKGASELLLVVYNDNKRAINLDRKLGFAPTILPALEPLLEEEKEKTGRRQIVMQKKLR